nr:TPA_asm: hypothetical protein HUJ06_013522 [Nelumbo nucifera]
MGLTRSELPGIAWLLRCSPTLETLELSFGHENFFQGLCIGSHFGPYFEDWKREMFFPGLAYHLKIIHIIGFTGNSYEVELEFLLKNALVLEKIVFCSLKEHQSGKMFSEMILSFPRGSASAAIYSFEKYYD